jgi:hypothetical protein
MIIKSIQKMLTEGKFESSIIQASEKHGNLFDQIIVDLGKDYLIRERILEILCRPMDVNLELDSSPLNRHYSITFQVKLPFEVQNLTLTQVASLLLFINQLSDWPGFQLDELQNQVSFRYVWLVKEPLDDSFLLFNIVGNILLNLDIFSETIEQVASSRLTFDEVLKQITEIRDRNAT